MEWRKILPSSDFKPGIAVPFRLAECCVQVAVYGGFGVSGIDFLRHEHTDRPVVVSVDGHMLIIPVVGSYPISFGRAMVNDHVVQGTERLGRISRSQYPGDTLPGIIIVRPVVVP